MDRRMKECHGRLRAHDSFHKGLVLIKKRGKHKRAAQCTRRQEADMALVIPRQLPKVGSPSVVEDFRRNQGEC